MSNKAFRLPKKFAEEWVAALRSGDYKQGQSVLVANDVSVDGEVEYKYCCLGVAGQLCGCEMRTFEDTHLDNDPDCESQVGSLDNVPEQLRGSQCDGLAVKLALMNDNLKTFDEIADWIEQNVEFYE